MEFYETLGWNERCNHHAIADRSSLRDRLKGEGYEVDRLDTLITEEQRAAVRAPIETARTLPRQAFTSEAWFELETAHIFGRQWCALGFVQQAQAPGDLVPVDLCGIPLLMVRGDDDQIRVFHNVVPYDGCLAVIEAAQGQSHIVTPYHGWHYDLAGKLTAIPYWDGTAQGNLDALRGRSGDLVEVRSQVLYGIVFVDLSGSADDFETHMTPLQRALSAYRTEVLDIGRDGEGQPLLDGELLATNWKTHYENWAVNVLHESFVHEIYAESPQIPRVDGDGKKTYSERMDGPLMALSYRERDFAETYEMDDLPFTSLGIEPDVWPEWALIGSFFPNLHLAVFAHFFHMIIALPDHAGQTRTVRAQFYERASAANPDLLDDRLEFLQGFKEAGFEDGRITEAVQKARRSPVFEQQFYSPFWDTMHHAFSNMVLDSLEQSDTGH